MLLRGGYRIKILNTINFKQSMRYNPFRYIRCENDILKLVNCIMENTKGEDSKGGEDFWSKAEALYYQALIAYIWYEAPEEEKNFTMLLDMLNASEVREEDENFKNAVDFMFERSEISYNRRCNLYVVALKIRICTVDTICSNDYIYRSHLFSTQK